MTTTLVLGGTGKTGRRIVQRLQAAGRPVRVGTPSGTPPFDWTDEATWPAALDGVGSVHVTYYPDLAVPGAAEAVGTFADLAVARGVRRLVLLSGRGEEGRGAASRPCSSPGRTGRSCAPPTACSLPRYRFGRSSSPTPTPPGSATCPCRASPPGRSTPPSCSTCSPACTPPASSPPPSSGCRTR